MSYDFTFDLTALSQAMFKEIAELSEKENFHQKIGDLSRNFVKKFRVEKITGLSLSDSITLVEDLINIHIKNSVNEKYFFNSKKRALFLPHCCRKYMDSRCKADFDPETSSYICNHCSTDCLVNQATKLAKKENYDVYILAGSSCVKKILKKNEYEGIIGVACTEELRLATKFFDGNSNIYAQGVPLIKNGCSETRFNFESLKRIIIASNKNNKKLIKLNILAH